ncbi:MAG: asparaginase [Bacteroidota bacterium]|nr:asparaginase [Bacteroidota bacterium]MDP4251294.1 asparaginase [Bacteroidota bacterium]
MPILILVTGGTFDKEYNELTGELFFKETHLPEMLRLGRNLAETRIERLEMIDSLFMTDEYRNRLVVQCREAPEENIIITHGTDTMAETAAFLGKAATGKTIVLTGAMIPYKFGSSDGLFNLGSAMAFVQTLPRGVYVAMNGSYFPAGRVRKNKATGLFEKIG